MRAIRLLIPPCAVALLGAVLALAGPNAQAAQQPSPTPPAASSTTPPAIAQPTPPTDPLDRLQAALDAERDHRNKDAQSKKKKEARNSAEHNAAEYYKDKSERIQRVRNLPEAEKAAALADLVHDLHSTGRSDELVQVSGDLLDQAEKKRAAETVAYIERAEKTLQQTGETVLRAKEPKELDSSIQEIGRLIDSTPTHNNPANTGLYRLTNRLKGAVPFLHRWQDYLQAQARQDPEAAGNIMRSIASQTSISDDTPLVPRSEILARVPAEPASRELLTPNDADKQTEGETHAALREILAGTRTLDDIPAALGKLDELKKKPVRNPVFNAQASGLDAAVSALEALQAARRSLQADAEFSIAVPQLHPVLTGSSRGPEEEITRLRADLLALALPRVLGAGDEKPAPGERLEAVLRRLVEAARQRGDWDMVLRGVELSRQLGTTPGAYTSSDLSSEKEAFRQFRIGQTMESAGQAQQAAAAYLLALKTGVQDLPVSLIGERLGAIQKDHPQDYAAANTFILNQPAAAPKPATTTDTDARITTGYGIDPSGNLGGTVSISFNLVVPRRNPAGK